MPFKSKAQMKWLYANKPSLAAKFAEETPKGAKLPERISSKSNSEKRQLARQRTYKRRTTSDSKLTKKLAVNKFRNQPLEAILEKPMIPAVTVNTQEMWDELSSVGAVSYVKLPKDFRDTWNQYVAGDTVNGDLAALINQNAYLELDSRAEKGDPRGAGLLRRQN